MMRTTVSNILLLSSLFMFPGCTPTGRGLRVEYVEGVITLDGEPLDMVTVTFHPKNPGSAEVAAAGTSNERGVYKLSATDGNPEAGTTPGEYAVTVSKLKFYVLLNGVKTSVEDAPEAAAELPSIQEQILHPFYGDATKTPLTATVKRGKNRIDLELKKAP